MKKFWLVVYYILARHLPSKHTPVIGNLFNRFRVLCCKYIFACSGRYINIEPNVYLGKV